MLNILILCTANSARSILGEALINRLGEGRFKGYSAGSHPRGEPNPDGLAMLADKGYDVSVFSSKSWDVFAGPDCTEDGYRDHRLRQRSRGGVPALAGAPVKAHWGIPDPAHKGETAEERRAAFEEAYRLMELRVRALTELPAETMAAEELRRALADIGRLDGATQMALEA